MIRSAPTLAILAACLAMPGLAFAHEVPSEQRIEMSMRRVDDRLIVRMRIPSSLLGAAPIQAAADDVARNLDVRQNDAPLPAPAVSAIRAGDRAWTDVELTYRIDAQANGISARVNGFQTAPMQPVRTAVTFVPLNGRAQVVSVVGPVTRVDFDPPALDAARDFLARALRSVLTAGDHILLLVCLLLPLRGGRETVRLLAALAAGQAVGIVAFTFFAATTPALTLVAAMVAASAVVCAAVQNMVSARNVLVTALTVAFGVLSGVAFADTFGAARQFAGAHQTAAFALFLCTLVLAEWWLGAVMWATRAWLDRRGAPPRMLAIVGSALIAHTAIHEVIDRGDALTTQGLVTIEHPLVWLATGWTIVMLGVAVMEWLRQLRAPAYSTSP